MDFNSGKITKHIPDAHIGNNSGVSSVLFPGGSSGAIHFISGGHDGSIKVWDMRTFKTIAEISKKSAHKRKFDEGVLCLASHSEAPFFASGGADSVVNIYELNVQ